jgi:protocatechuate 3,4-dioxygenase beta subunit
MLYVLSEAPMTHPPVLSRRRVLALGAVLPLALRAAAAGLVLLPPTLPRADADDEPTPPRTEGPYFKPRSPERRVLREERTPGSPFTLTGRVVSTRGAPLEKALIDVWQTDGDGVYDLEGYRMRGHQFTDKDGTFRLETVVPGLYPGRTRHIHVKVQPAGGRVLTTQLFFPGEPGNRRDGLYSTWLRMRVSEDRTSGTFDFVVAT